MLDGISRCCHKHVKHKRLKTHNANMGGEGQLQVDLDEKTITAT